MAFKRNVRPLVVQALGIAVILAGIALVVVRGDGARTYAFMAVGVAVFVGSTGYRARRAGPSLARGPVRNSVRELRSDRGLSQGQLGEALKVSRQTINAIETERYTHRSR